MAHGQLRLFLRSLRRAVDPQGGGGRTDPQLLERFLTQHDDAAFEVLVWRHGPMVLNVCRRLLGDGEDVEDAFQATFFALARKAGSIGRRDAVGGWLYRVAYRVALRARLRSAQRARREQAGVDLLPAPASADADWHGVRDVLDEEINRLPVRYRVPFVLCCLEGKTSKEAAEYLGCAPGTITSRLARARLKLRGRLVRGGLTLSVAALTALLDHHARAATMPAALVETTTSAAAGFASSSLGTAAAPLPAAALAEGVLRSMFVAQLKAVAVVLIVASLAGLGGGLLCHRSLAAQPTLLGPVAKPRPVESTGTKREARPQPEAAHPSTSPRYIWRERQFFSSQGGDVLSVTFSPDSRKVLAGTMEGLVQQWEVRDGRRLLDYRTDQGYVEAVTLTPDGMILATAGGKDLGQPGTVKLWDVATMRIRATLQGHTDMVTCAAFSPDGKTLATGSVDRTVRLWDSASGKDRALFHGPFREALFAVAFSPDGKLLATCGGTITVKQSNTPGEVHLWEVASGKLLRRYEEAGGTITGVAFSPDGRLLLTGGYDKTARLLDVTSGKVLRVLGGHEAYIRSVAFSPDGRTVATASGDETVQIWDVRTGRRLARLAGDGGVLSAVAFSPDGKWLAAGSGAMRLKEESSQARPAVRLWQRTAGNRPAKPGDL